ncbi:nicotinamide mononucleotide transporter [Candidatus Pacearchaeota archaeon]|nr:nicotinamide mononucleotide transporter [Candidatus Pacearchaeota archaeon]
MWIEWLATFLSLFGYIFIAIKRLEGFYIWIVANLIWVYIGVISQLWGMTTLFSAYTLISLYAIVFWKKKNN